MLSQAQLTVTPKVEGILEIVGVRWKLSGSVAGFCKFDPDLFRKKIPHGRRKSKKSFSNHLKFLVTKVYPLLVCACAHFFFLILSLLLDLLIFKLIYMSLFSLYPEYAQA